MVVAVDVVEVVVAMNLHVLAKRLPLPMVLVKHLLWAFVSIKLRKLRNSFLSHSGGLNLQLRQRTSNLSLNGTVVKFMIKVSSKLSKNVWERTRWLKSPMLKSRGPLRLGL